MWDNQYIAYFHTFDRGPGHVVHATQLKTMASYIVHPQTPLESSPARLGINPSCCPIICTLILWLSLISLNC